MCECCLAQMTRQILISTNTILKNQEQSDPTPPNWNANTLYFVNDKVKKGNDIYKCIKENISDGTNKPPNATYWVLVV